jgi:hypothetical protein
VCIAVVEDVTRYPGARLRLFARAVSGHAVISVACTATAKTLALALAFGGKLKCKAVRVSKNTSE